MIGKGPGSLAAANTRWGAMIIEELSRLGTPLFCTSPGSRSTPLTAALAARAELPQRVVIDERGAAFCALGASKATGRPAVMITTSGTAMANAFPAVIEAERSGVPLLLISTDRPAELRESGANQTIDQIKLFGDRVRWFADLPPPDSGYPSQSVLTTLAEAVHRAQCLPAGPVHLNVQFREPLGPSGPFLPPDDPCLRTWRTQDTPWSVIPTPVPTISPQAIHHAADHIRGEVRGLLVVGTLSDPQQWEVIEPLAAALQWPIMADVGAGFAPRSHPNTLPLIDVMLGSDDFRRRFAPDVVLHIGGPVVSKRHVAWLDEHPPKAHILFRADPRRHDPSHTVTMRVHGALAHSLPALTEALVNHTPTAETTWLADWQRVHRRAADAVETCLQSASGLHEPHVARIISEEAGAIFVGNSMPIRDLDHFGRSGATHLTVQRGASGIDGLIATAAGWAEGHGRPTVAIIGDVSALHDLSSLAMLREQRVPLKLVIINNGGGGIFSFLPVASFHQGFERHFATAHPFAFAPLAAAMQIPHHHPVRDQQLRTLLRTHSEGAMIIEVCTDRAENIALHRRMFAAAVAAVEETA